jgi:glycosyltransferase involved in cell wall biosynthesis
MDGVATPEVPVVCPLVPYPPASGGVKRTLRLLEAIERAGGAPHVLTTDSQRESAEGLRARGWRVEVVPERPPTLTSRAGQHLRRLPSPFLDGVAERLRELAAGRCPFVQLESTQSAYYLGSLHGTPTVLSLHNVDSEMLRSVARAERALTPAWARTWNRALATRTVERRTLPRATAVLCVSDDDAGALAALARRVVVAPNGVDDELFEVDPALPLGERVLFFGRLDYPPNVHGLERTLAEVWPRVRGQRPEALLAVAGAGMPERLAGRVAEAERVEALGFVPDLRSELERARVVLVPVWQGGGTRLKVLEGLAAGRPLAGTPLGVAGLGFEAGRHGLVARGAAELADAVVTLLADRERSLRLAREGRLLAERFHWRDTLRPAEELYRELLDVDTGPGR